MKITNIFEYLPTRAIYYNIAQKVTFCDFFYFSSYFPVKLLNFIKTCAYSNLGQMLYSATFVMLKMSKYCDHWNCQSREETFECSSNQKSQTKSIWCLLDVFDWKNNYLFLLNVFDWKNKIICLCWRYLIRRTVIQYYFEFTVSDCMQ